MTDPIDAIQNRLNQFIINPDGNLGQHFLVDPVVINLLADQVIEGCEVLEVGAGDGRLTKVLVQKASKVIAIEIDKRYKPILTMLSKEHPKLKIIIGNVLDLNLGQIMKPGFQIISSLPYHISEPFLHQIAGLDIKNAVLLVGLRLAQALETTDARDPHFGQMSLLAQAFFDFELLQEVPKQTFYPIPRTNSALIKLCPKKEDTLSMQNQILRRFFITRNRGTLVKNTLKEGLVNNQHISQNQAREKIASLNLEVSILNKSFDQLNRQGLGKLYEKLRYLV